MRLCLVEDSAVADVGPLADTRPVFDLLLGSRTLGDRAARAFRLGPWGQPGGRAVVVRPHLEPLQRAGRPHAVVNDPRRMSSGPVLVVNGRWVPAGGPPVTPDRTGWVGLCEGRPACAVVGPGETAGLEPGRVDAWFEAVAARSPARDVGGWWVRRPWDLVARNAEHIARDFDEAGASGGAPEGVAVVGPADRLAVHPSAFVEPFCTFDTASGPITVAAGAVVQSFTRVEGPCYVGPGTRLYRAHLRGGVTLGPGCRVGGEVEATIVQGHTNKYHEGFLGHSYVGEWVNLGALTSSSDLRNDYGEVAVPIGGDPVPTGQAKVGCFIGDFTRTGMGCLLNTGTVAGVMCSLLPAGPLLPKHVPSFAAVLFGRVAPNVSLDRLFETARVVKGRRGQTFTEVEERLFLDLFEQTRLERARAFQAQAARNERHPAPAVGVAAER